MDSCTVGLLTLNSFNVDHKFLSVDLGHLPGLLALVVSTNNLSKLVHKPDELGNTNGVLDSYRQLNKVSYQI